MNVTMHPITAPNSRRRRYLYGLLICLLAATVVAFAWVFLANRPPRHVRNWPYVKVGMTKSEVVRLLGEPTTRRGPAKVEGPGDSQPTIAAVAGLGAAIFGGLDEYFAWESAPKDFDKLSDKEKVEKSFSSLFGPSDESFVVYFDMQGRVKKFIPPKAGLYSSLYKDQG